MGFSQLDIIVLDIMLVGIICYLNNKLDWFSIWFGLAIALKTLPILIFIPLLLAKEKRVFKIIVHIIEAMLFSFIFMILFNQNAGYQAIHDYLYQGHDFIGRIVFSGISVSFGKASLFIVILICVCIYMYDQTYSEGECWKPILMVPITVFGSFFLLVEWHIQWFVLLIPFFYMVIMLNYRRRSMKWVELILECVIYLIALLYLGDAGPALIGDGVISYFVGGYTGSGIADALNNIQYIREITVSMFVALLGYGIIVNCKDIMQNKISCVLPEIETRDKKFAYAHLILFMALLVILGTVYFACR